MNATQYFQKTDPALTFRTLRPGKKIIAHICAIAVSSLMPTAGIVHAHIIGNLQSRSQDRLFFRVIHLFVPDQNIADLSDGNIYADIPQLSGNQRLSDMSLIMLIQYEILKVGTEMRSPQFIRQPAVYIFAIGCLPTFRPIPCIAWLKSDILNRVLIISFINTARRNNFRPDDFFFMNFKRTGFMPFRRTGAFFILLGLWFFMA
ncbi:hypothetical protein [Desulfonema ishimotonii]|uniref:hypothetical protein n=1 Tax=Desulfonema ishimotonii TaxID=45657 RepID=UPI000F578C61|nr:hypothetical protein [Desulfonema ishimotonii]